ncbi:hypothetical protein EVAR_19426_1 [Eumeta japonica]|uniref:Uncharacterized protein n=1 Tax=Eumeta variegata TaxID=151549 RepID=A0A4C1TRN0_EUMVA|nr:hypothetical protein EVAR_19426_1 [Eumeta japonica]
MRVTARPTWLQLENWPVRSVKYYTTLSQDRYKRKVADCPVLFSPVKSSILFGSAPRAASSLCALPTNKMIHLRDVSDQLTVCRARPIIYVTCRKTPLCATLTRTDKKSFRYRCTMQADNETDGGNVAATS